MENNGNSVCQENKYTDCSKCGGRGTSENEAGKEVACDCCDGTGKEIWLGWSL